MGILTVIDITSHFLAYDMHFIIYNATSSTLTSDAIPVQRPRDGIVFLTMAVIDRTTGWGRPYRSSPYWSPLRASRYNLLDAFRCRIWFCLRRTNPTTTSVKDEIEVRYHNVATKHYIPRYNRDVKRCIQWYSCSFPMRTWECRDGSNKRFVIRLLWRLLWSISIRAIQRRLFACWLVATSSAHPAMSSHTRQDSLLVKWETIMIRC